MGVDWNKVASTGKKIAKGACGYMEGQERNLSRNRNLSEEQREAYRSMAESFGETKDRLSDSNHDDYDTDSDFDDYNY